METNRRISGNNLPFKGEMELGHHSTVLVVGGGVIGCSIALEMVKQGKETTLLEKGALLSEASTASAGMICPEAVKFDSEAPSDLLVETQEIYEEWIMELESLSQVPVQYVKEGMVRLVYHETEREKIKEALSAKGIGTWLDPEEVSKMELDIQPNHLGGLFFQNDGQLHPIYLAKSLNTALQRKKCLIKQWVPALSLIQEQNRIVGVRTSEGDYFADYTIITAGAWSSALLNQLGIDMPIFPVKGQMFAVRSGETTLKKTVQGPGGMIIPRQDGTLTVGVTHEKKGFSKISSLSGISQIYQSAIEMIPQLAHAELLKTWSGLRPGTPDGLPYIGKIDGFEGIMVASGHYGIGILLAPITAKIVSQFINGEDPSVQTKPYLPERFQNKMNPGMDHPISEKK